MSKIKEIGTRNGYPGLLEWLKNSPYRNIHSCDPQRMFEFAKSIAALKDEAARKLALDILSQLEFLIKSNEEMHKELDTLLTALTKIDEDLDKESKSQAKK
jgi:hypothetical protein